MAAASAIAVRPTQLAPLFTPSFLPERVALMSASPLFQGLAQLACERIAVRARPKTFERDETVFLQGEPAHGLLLIRTGSIKITQIGPGGTEVVLWMFGPGHLAGALSDRDACIHTNSAYAMDRCTALSWILPPCRTSCVTIRR